MPRRKTHAEFVADVEALVGDEYEVLGKYETSKIKIKMKHRECSNEYDVRPTDFLGGKRCPKCNNTVPKTTEEFKQEVFELVGDEYLVLGDYRNRSTKIKMKHSKCSHVYEVMPYSFIRGVRCQKCIGNKLKTTEEFKQEVFELVGDEYLVLGEYKNARTKIKMKHNKCNHEYEVEANSFIRGASCPKCNGSPLKTTEEFKQEVFELVGDEYLVLGEYKYARTKIKMKHNKCNHEYEVVPTNFLRGRRCPHCRESRGEKRLEELLTRLHVPYTIQYKFEDCRSIRPLPFDFAIFNHAKNLTCLIEYDGRQHFEPVKEWGGLLALEEVKSKDAIKTNYCADHNIPLIRIPYWDFDNIDAILTKELRKLGVIKTQKIAS